MQLYTIIYYSLAALHVSSDIFAHHQEHLNCITASGITRVCHCRLESWECSNTPMPLMMSENIAGNMYSSQGIINYPIQLHLVGYFRTRMLIFCCYNKGLLLEQLVEEKMSQGIS